MPPNLKAVLFWIFRTITLYLSGFAALGLIVIALSIEWIGQHNLMTAFLIYLPGWIWALPLAIMAPLLLVVRPSYGLCALLLILVYWGPWLGYELITPKSDLQAQAEIRVLSWNRGQAGGQSLQPFKNRVQPNVIAFQDAARRLVSYQAAPEYADLPLAASMGEFLVLSRFPVRATESISFPVSLSLPKSETVTVAARFEIDGPSGTLALYNVHLPTPRDTLSFYRRGAFLLGVIGLPGTEWGRKRAEYQKYWDGLLALNRQLVERMTAEKIPVLVTGDFNSPALGPAHRLYAASLHDSHEEGGRGYGYSFPGETGNPVALLRPWLRLDRILAGKEWELVSQETETGRTSQHLAVFAAYKKSN